MIGLKGCIIFDAYLNKRGIEEYDQQNIHCHAFVQPGRIH
jgi:hypothetical protein